MAVVESALQALNAEMVRSLKDLGVSAKGYSGRDRHLIEATTVPDLGRVGLPAKIDAAALKTILADPALPVFYSVAEDAGREPLNINADDVALALAVALQASRLVYLTDTGGLLGRDRQLISKIYEPEVDALISDGTITGGMLVKVKACLEALKQGVGLVDLDKDVKFLQAKQMFSNGTTIALRKPVSL
jgi:acetylglutamate kinase